MFNYFNLTYTFYTCYYYLLTYSIIKYKYEHQYKHSKIIIVISLLLQGNPQITGTYILLRIIINNFATHSLSFYISAHYYLLTRNPKKFLGNHQSKLQYAVLPMRSLKHCIDCYKYMISMLLKVDVRNNTQRYHV